MDNKFVKVDDNFTCHQFFEWKILKKMLQFEFSKTNNKRIFLYINTIQGAKIMDIVLENWENLELIILLILFL